MRSGAYLLIPVRRKPDLGLFVQLGDADSLPHYSERDGAVVRGIFFDVELE